MGNCLDKREKEKDIKDYKTVISRAEDYKISDSQNSNNRSYPSTPHLYKSELVNNGSTSLDKRNSLSSLVNTNVKDANSTEQIANPELNNSKSSEIKKGSDSPGRRSEILRGINNTLEFGKSRHLVALFDYQARTSGEIGLTKRRRYLLIDSSDSEWWLVEERGDASATGARRGYVPAQFLAPELSYESEDWFFRNITRKDAERYLLQPSNRRGCFLVRASETTQGALCLSVLDRPLAISQTTGYSAAANANDNYIPSHPPGPVVNHYKVKRASRDSVYITTRKVFPSLHALIQFYSAAPNGLCCALTHCCPRPLPLVGDLSFQTRDKWEIDRSSLELLVEVGSGQFGQVWKGLWNGTTLVAIKTLKQGSMSRDEFLKEARTMKGLCHPNLVRLFAICSDEPIYIVTEFMNRGSLLDHLQSNGAGAGLLLKQLLDFVSQIAAGMAYLEARSLVHRDLAARNCLVGDNDVCKVADFGLARLVEGGCGGTYEASQGTRFPVKWTAPEAALLGKFSTKSDVWSFGVLVMEVMTRGQVPYPCMTNAEALRRVEAGYRMQRPSDCPPCVYEAMLQCWNSRPELRPTFASMRDLFDDLFTNAESGYRAAECISR